MVNISSIDPIELAKFNKTSQEWWDPEGEFKMLHKINPTRSNYIKLKAIEHFNLDPLLDKPLANLNLIDIGSGGGLICKSMYEFGANVTGLDANKQNSKASTHHANEHGLNINYINDTVENYASSNAQKFDIALCLEVIEHVANPDLFINNVSSLVKPGGLLIYSTINRTLKSYGLAIIMAEYVLGWIPKQTHQYSKFIRPSELTNMLSNTNWRLTELKGMNLSLPENIWHMSDDIDVNYFAIFKHTEQ